MRKIQMSLVFLAILFLISGCNQSLSTSKTDMPLKNAIGSAQDEFTILGDVKLGASEDSVVSKLGLPKVKRKQGQNKISYIYPNIAIDFVDGRINTIMSTDSEYSTKNGIHVRDTASKVASVYKDIYVDLRKTVSLIHFGNNTLILFINFLNDKYTLDEIAFTSQNPADINLYFVDNCALDGVTIVDNGLRFAGYTPSVSEPIEKNAVKLPQDSSQLIKLLKTKSDSFQQDAYNKSLETTKNTMLEYKAKLTEYFKNNGHYPITKSGSAVGLLRVTEIKGTFPEEASNIFYYSDGKYFFIETSYNETTPENSFILTDSMNDVRNTVPDDFPLRTKTNLYIFSKSSKGK